jgi:hypothetical protein
MKTRKTGNKWRTENCGRCHEEHVGYSGKLDARGVEYVVCQNTNKRINVGPILGQLRSVDIASALMGGKWVYEKP